MDLSPAVQARSKKKKKGRYRYLESQMDGHLFSFAPLFPKAIGQGSGGLWSLFPKTIGQSSLVGGHFFSVLWWDCCVAGPSLREIKYSLDLIRIGQDLIFLFFFIFFYVIAK